MVLKFIFGLFFLLFLTSGRADAINWKTVFSEHYSWRYAQLRSEPELKDTEDQDIKFFVHCSTSMFLDHLKSLCSDMACLGKQDKSEKERYEHKYVNDCFNFKNEKVFVYNYCIQSSTHKNNKNEYCSCKAIQQGFSQNLNCNSIL